MTRYLEKDLKRINVKLYTYQYEWLKANNLNISKYLRYLLEKEIIKDDYDRIGTPDENTVLRSYKKG